MQTCDKVNVYYDNRLTHDLFIKLFNSIAKKYDCRYEHDRTEGCIKFIGDYSLKSHVQVEIIETFSLIFGNVV
jgi:hypothetical protein